MPGREILDHKQGAYIREARNFMRWKHHLVLATVMAAATGISVLSAPTQAWAIPISAKARAIYTVGLTLKRQNPSQALADFRLAASLAPTWEAPVYQEGVLLSTSHFVQAIPVLKHAAKLNPTDDTVWNILGWGYYVAKNFTAAEAAFSRQLQIQPHSPNAAWGLANCYGNSQVRQYAEARNYLQSLLNVPQFRSAAAKLLTEVPPIQLDAAVHPDEAVTYEDAIGMLLSYRNDVRSGSPGSSPYAAQDGSVAVQALQPYIAWAAAHQLLQGLDIPSFQATANRLFLALLLARYYQINAYDYIRPFVLSDMSAVPADQRMVVNSILATRLMTTVAAHQFEPNATMPRSTFQAVVTHANQVMKSPPSGQQLATPPAPPVNLKPIVYFFSTSQPGGAVQQTDLKAHAGVLTDVGFTYFPFLADARSNAAAKLAGQLGTHYVVPTATSGSDAAAALSLVGSLGENAFLVLGNYNQLTNQPDPGIVHQLLGNPTDSQGLAQEVAHLAAIGHMAGVTVDFENLWPTDRQAYVSFLGELRTALNQASTSRPLQLMVCLPERSKDDNTSPYDYAGLAMQADLVMLITYDEHSAGSKPGAISQLPNDDRVVKYALTQMPADKILLGVADYGYDWSATGGAEVSMDEAMQLARDHHATVNMDPLAQSPWFTYTDVAGVRHTVWFTNEQSVAAELGIVNQYGLAGISVWHLGADNADFWAAVQATLVHSP